MRGDLSEVYRIFKGFDNIDANYCCTIDRSNITRRQSSLKICGKIFTSNELKHFFNRVVNVQNSVSSVVLDSTKVTSLKNKLQSASEIPSDVKANYSLNWSEFTSYVNVSLLTVLLLVQQRVREAIVIALISFPLNVNPVSPLQLLQLLLLFPFPPSPY